MANGSFQRHPPPLLFRCALGVVMDGVMRPMVRIMDKHGRADRIFQGMAKRQMKALSEKNPFKGYVPTKHDVFVAVYIKSGTNWTMQIVHQLLNHGLGEYEHIHNVIPWPDTKIMGALKNYAIPLEDESVWRNSPEQKRAIKTHFRPEDIPYSEDARYIHVIRDPKDVFVSSYFFFGQVFPVPSVDTWFKLFCSGNFMMFGSWAETAAKYWAQRHRPNVLLLSFKQMKRDLPGTVRNIADFLGVPAGEQIIQRVCEKSSFDYMKRIDDKFGGWSIVPWRKSTTMMRKGTQGGSAELLTPERQREMDEFFIAELKRLGSDLPYEEFADLSPGKSERVTAA